MKDRWTTNRVIAEMREGRRLRMVKHRRTGSEIFHLSGLLQPIPERIVNRLISKFIVSLTVHGDWILADEWAGPLEAPPWRSWEDSMGWPRR